jgi:CPA1 family monovalent cation:H+ antiporter
MSIFEIIALLLTVVGVLSYVNDRFIKLPTAVGLMGISLALSLGFVALEKNGIDIGCLYLCDGIHSLLHF